MRDVGTGGKNDWVALWLPMVLIDEKGQVVDSVEEGHPEVA